MSLRLTVLVVAAALLGGPSGPTRAPRAPSDYLYLWASSAESSGPDFLTLYDVRDQPSADHYGTLIAGGVFLLRDPATALFVVGAVALTLIFIGIHNAWDVVAHLAVRQRPTPSE